MAAMAIFFLVVVTVFLTTKHVLGQNTELTYVITEERPAMTPIGNVIEDSNIRDLVSPDDISDLRFSFLTERNPQASYLWINSTNGDLRTAVRINRESICQRLTLCELRVQTYVQAQIGAFFMIIQVKVTVTDINDNAPQFTPSIYTLRISEGEIPGVSFPLPAALDPDMGSGNSVVGYSLVAGSVPFTLSIDGNAPSFDIRVRLEANLDREKTSSYQMLVLAMDGGIPKLTGTLTVNIEVTDINDNSPVFENLEYLVNISDSTAIDSVVAVVKATDLDSGDNGLVTYIMAPSQEDQIVFSMFNVNKTSGVVRSKVPMDSYAGRSYRLAIEARDSGLTQRSARTDVVITVLDTHNSQPEILLNVFGDSGLAKVSELAELGRVVAHVAVTDPDSSLSLNGQVSCYLNNSDQFQLQPIVVKQYKVILVKRLDRELQTFHSVSVICEDSGSPSLSATSNFMVEVLDENDNTPVFDSFFYTADVTEGQVRDSDEIRDVILRLHATDKDTGPNAELTYRLADGSDSDFGIYRDGSLVVTNPLGVDREDKVKGDVRRLTILAVDNGKLPLTGTTTVVITIRDTNDNPPKFSEPMYFFSVPENTPIDRVVNNVSATDADLESNALFYFEIHQRDVNTVPFQISRGGVVKVAGSLDRESKASYDFRVVAYDLGEPARLSSTVTVYVKVTDMNDNAPEFVFPNEDNYTISVPHTLSENTAFASVLAIDKDEGRNGELVYARDSGNGSKFFDVEANSGHVILVRSLSPKEIGLHVIVIVAHDRGVEQQMATQSVLHIMVYEGNATIPFQNNGLGFRNILVVIVLVVITAVLALAILLTILLIRRVDKQRRLYNTKTEEAKVDTNFRGFSPCSVADLESPTTLSDMAGDPRDGGKKKKEVSFSLQEDKSANQPQTMTTFNPVASDKYDAISENARGKIKCDMLSSNHYQADRPNKSSGAKKDINSFNYHLVQPAAATGQKHKHTLDPAHQHDDNSSDVSGDSTSDSGRGGSDVELQSHGCVSKESVLSDGMEGEAPMDIANGVMIPVQDKSNNQSVTLNSSCTITSTLNGLPHSRGDTSFASQRGFDAHNNLSPIISGSTSNINSNMRTPAKSVHFQNIHPEPFGCGSMVSSKPPTSFKPRSPRSPILPGVPANKHGLNQSRYATNTISEESGFVKMPNNVAARCSNPPRNDQDFHRSRMLNDNSLSKQNSRHMGSVSPSGGQFIDIPRTRSSLSQRSNSNSGLDGTDTWDGDTTTSGSYTVDPHELCDEIDKLFFDEFQDVIV